jgi:hypothetical protein
MHACCEFNRERIRPYGIPLSMRRPQTELSRKSETFLEITNRFPILIDEADLDALRSALMSRLLDQLGPKEQDPLSCAKSAHGVCQEIASIPLEFQETPGFRVSPEPVGAPQRQAEQLCTGVSKLWDSPIPITGKDPNRSRTVYARRGPKRSQSQPAATRANTVMATEPTMHQPTCSAVRCNSSRTIFINRAMPNHAKKHRKNAIHDMWKARMAGDVKSNSAMRAALALERIFKSGDDPSAWDWKSAFRPGLARPVSAQFHRECLSQV